MKHAVEIWRPVAGFEETHECSNYGRVRSIPRETRNRCGPFMTRGKVLRPCLVASGTVVYHLTAADGRNVTRQAIRIIAEAWVPNPERCSHVYAKDGDQRNARPENVEWTERSMRADRRWRRMAESPECTEYVANRAEKAVLQRHILAAAHRTSLMFDAGGEGARDG